MRIHAAGSEVSGLAVGDLVIGARERLGDALAPGGIRDPVGSGRGARPDGEAFVSLLNAVPQARRGMRSINLTDHADGVLLARLSAPAGAGWVSRR